MTSTFIFIHRFRSWSLAYLLFYKNYMNVVEGKLNQKEKHIDLKKIYTEV